jgi:O-antigen/teichoic acid export membrane protein
MSLPKATDTAGDSPADVPTQGWRALRWNYTGNAVRSASQFLIGVVLARLLGPSDFGTVAVSWLMIGVGMLVADLGLGVVVVQRKELHDDDLRFVFTMQVCLGAILCAVNVALAAKVARYFGRPDAAPVFRAMSLLFLLQSFGATPLALMRRRLDFRKTQLVGICSYLVGYLAVGIPLAVGGFGVWSLVVAQLTQSAVSSVLALRRYAFSLKPTLSARSPGLGSSGLKVVGSNLASYGFLNLDSFVVGRLLGVDVLGVYGRAMALVAAPAGSLTAGLQGVLFAAAARFQSELPRLRRAYFGATSVIAALALPLFATTAAVSETVIGGVYGPRWMSAVPLLPPLALAAAASTLLGQAGSVLTGVNRVDIELRVQAFALVALVPTMIVAGHFSAQAVAWGLFAVQCLRAVWLMAALLNVLEARWSELLASLTWPVIAALTTAAVTRVADQVVAGIGAPGKLCIDVAIAAATLVACARLMGRRWLTGSHGAILVAGDRMPGVLRAWMNV